MNSPVDPVLTKLVQQELNSLQEEVKNMSAQCENERTKVQSELQNCNSVLEELQQRMERLEIGQQNMCRRTDDVGKEMISKRQGEKLKEIALNEHK